MLKYFENTPESEFVLTTEVPQTTQAVIGVPKEGITKMYVNGKLVWKAGSFINKKYAPHTYISSHIAVKVGAGKYVVKAVKY